MSTYRLKVVTPSRELLNEDVERIVVRTTSGDVGILKGHINYISPLAIGALKIVTADQKTRIAAIAGGMIKVDKSGTTILTNTCEWADEIDVERAKRAEQRARAYLEAPTEYHTEQIANLKLKRALNRINIVDKYL